MAKIMTLAGDAGLGRPEPTEGECKCVFNTRTKRGARLCFVGKGRGKTRSGWIFKPGTCTPPRR